MHLLRPDPLLVVGPPLSAAEIASAVQVPASHPDPAAFIDALQDGCILRHFDFVARLDRRTSLTTQQIEPLRRMGDDLADRTVELLGLAESKQRGKDVLALINGYLEEKEREMGAEKWANEREEDVVWRLQSEMKRDPPDGVSGFVPVVEGGKRSRRATPLDLLEPITGPPSLAEGQAVFSRYAPQLYQAFGHFSLAGGFSAPKLAAVMRETNYLTSDSRDATHKRLLETSLFVLDAMADMTTGDSRGWRSAYRVRMLHAQVRIRIRQGRARHNTYDEEENGVPINQADLLAVLGAFMISPVWSLRRIGVRMTEREEAAYQVCWRHIGYYLGIKPELLLQLYGESFAIAETYFASLAFALFPAGAPPSETYATPQYKILSAIAGRPPKPTRVEHHLELCRLLLGPSLADQLALPRGSLRDVLSVDLEIWTGWALLTFGRFYSRTPILGRWRGRKWETERRRWFQWVIELVVVWQLGERRTLFVWRDGEKHSLKLDVAEGEEPGIEMGPHVGKAVRTTWRNLLVEMGIVVGATAVLGIGALAFGAKWLRS
ncbi:hypothetical protein JCM10908_005350 [Rhodotorula pacifica]|uniref:oxygenase MpaB family protein n=1 Tax=Rhodotorula pacifica TaxID=1495444 RepID=UPI0031819032